MNPLFRIDFRIDFSISDSLKIVRKSVLIYETIIASHLSRTADDPVATNSERCGLFLSSSPSVRPPEHCFVMPSRVADGAKNEHICNFQGSNGADFFSSNFS